MTEHGSAAGVAVSVVHVSSGVVRHGAAEVEVGCDPSLIRFLTLQAIDVEGRVIAQTGFNEARVSILGATAAARLPLPEDRPVGALRVVPAGAEAEVEYTPDFQLHRLFFASPQAFAASKVARRRGERPRDKETHLYMVRQMARAYAVTSKGKESELTVTMTCSYGYRAAELLDEKHAHESLTLINCLHVHMQMQKFSEQLESRSLSLLTAQWHAAAAARDRAAFEAALRQILSNAESYSRNSLAFTMCYNSVRGMAVLAGYCILCLKVEAALAALAGIRTILTAAGRVFAFHPAHLDEFTRTCRIAVPLEDFENVLRGSSNQQVGDMLQLRMPHVKLTLGQAASEQLIRPSIRSDNPDALLVIIQGFTASGDISAAQVAG
ncbi:hypothetical protein J8J14_02335 [Roseomonas sp. SSH11]|uniref:Uncharacterized protein n=1 Tax=Pararoseomonas baculiformis TaxID=2820812 RepID=A0ABS4AAL2_9PROT|nr:hypothetical protein [Pararoseomonas baculiformis]MBP0443605.1 hypothetical protein [Pararoseomonas baculiformis]